MRVELTDVIENGWRQVADAARTTVNMGQGEGEPSMEWKKKMLLAEHSPIRKLRFGWKWYDLKSWVSGHFVRHKFGFEHFVRTQRSDRTGQNRDELPQGALVEHEAMANSQAIINTSRKRLCNQASKETKEAWIEALDTIKPFAPVLVSVCVPECIYRGFCAEFEPCGFSESPQFEELLKDYRSKQVVY